MPGDRAYFVLTAVGPDRPGLVNDISSLLREAGGNVEGSRMAVLGGEFAVILLLSAPPSNAAQVESCCTVMERSLQLRCILKRTAASIPPHDHVLYRLKVAGVDRPGIVQAISGFLGSRGINLQSLESRLSHAPHSGTAMFVAEAEIQVPGSVSLTSLRANLTTLCEQEDLDFSLEARS